MLPSLAECTYKCEGAFQLSEGELQGGGQWSKALIGNYKLAIPYECFKEFSSLVGKSVVSTGVLRYTEKGELMLFPQTLEEKKARV